MTLKHGRLGELWLNEVDISIYFASVDMTVKVAAADVTTFKASPAWKSYLSGLGEATVTASGFYDSSEADQVRETLQEVTANINGSGAGTPGLGQLSFMPAGAVAIGDQARLININSTDFKNGAKIGSAVVMDWTALSTAVVGAGNVLHILKSESVGTVTGPGDPNGLNNGGVQTTTGLIAHLHVTAMTGGDTHNFKLQDATTVNGVYSDIASGAFVNVTAVGSQRLVVPGTIRQFVQLVATINGHACTYGCVAART